ncbi:hypothetical protein [Clostridium felsineum]|uniref:Uncharacterized protein n=1 Tax=Clostridium felsineum TaxID=36839 RepID=A0A1S8LDF9_9CLOT|nr:hypothetical protein [Clostridium felsineum]URZ05915.1 hypothetical protein CLROS_012470 [Clostridium felsineum]URZ10952.1 hypothetical protein CROST_016680 [Clostridium felsineum]
MEKVLSKIEYIFLIFIIITGHIYLIKVLKDLNISLDQLRIFFECYLVMFVVVTLSFYVIFKSAGLIDNIKENIVHSSLLFGAISGQFFLMEYFKYIIAAELSLLVTHIGIKMINFLRSSKCREIRCALKKIFK